MSNQTGSPQACAPALAAWFSAPVPQPVDLVGSQRNHGPAPRPGRREPGLPKTSADAEDRCSRGRHMRTLQERTCVRDCVLCLRHIHTSEHQRAPHDIEARALVVGPAATVRRCRGQSGRPRRPSRCVFILQYLLQTRRPRHARKKCCCEEPGARCCEAADGQCRAVESLLRPGSTTQRVSLPTLVFECFERACTPQRGAAF